jgi:hypothetical protein
MFDMGMSINLQHTLSSLGKFFYIVIINIYNNKTSIQVRLKRSRMYY